MAIYGYCRISKKTQNIDRQIDNIKAVYPEAIIYKEAWTGTKMDRPEFTKLMKKVQQGDTIVFDSVSRMSRYADGGIKLYFELYEKGINLVFLKEGYINTEVFDSTSKQMISTTGNDIADIYIEATNRVIKLLAKKQIEKAFEQAQKEVDDLHERTSEGMKKAKERGSRIGTQKGDSWETKKAKDAKEVIKKHNVYFGGTLNNEETWKLAGINRMSFYKYKKELKEQNN